MGGEGEELGVVAREGSGRTRWEVGRGDGAKRGLAVMVRGLRGRELYRVVVEEGEIQGSTTPFYSNQIQHQCML